MLTELTVLPSFSVLQLLDSDQELYKNFPLVISERWQQEVVETVYEAVNSDTDKIEARKRAKNKQPGHEEGAETSWLCVCTLQEPLSDFLTVCFVCRLCFGEGLHNARLHAEAADSVHGAVAPLLLLSVP